ncbi:MAG: GNAT family N-acetyltransferase, partial [Pyrinomonadaceae bacterium]
MTENFKEYSRDLIPPASGAQSLRTEFEFHIEPMCEHDLIEVIEIEEVSRLSPWGWEAYHSQLMQGAMMQVARLTNSHAAPDLESGYSLLGYIAARSIINEIHINNIAVRPECRCHGVASALLRRTFDLAKHAGMVSAFLEVRSSNHEAQMLYYKFGFQLVGTRYN